jgi:multidrug efflux pump subunit AcrB
MSHEPRLTSIDDGLRAGKPELQLKLNDQGLQLGLTAHDLAEQVRHRFFGAEALRVTRGGNDIKVMVRLSQSEREQVSSLENVLLKTPSGTFVPLLEAATATKGQSTTSLSRRDGKRIYPVCADVVSGVGDNEISAVLEGNIVPRILTQFPGLRIKFAGEEEETDEVLGALGKGFLVAVGIIFALLALQFNSYIQPFLVFSVTPFALIGAIWGHALLGYDLSMVSAIGIMAMIGVVINDSLILVTAYNSFRRSGMGHRPSIIQAACRRLRPILLTTITTFFGLSPMMLETSEQAQFLIPMAVSISFGLIFGTFVVLVILPTLILLFPTKPA